MSLWRTVYRWSAVALLQLDRTCLFVCGVPLAQSGQEASWTLLQRLRFAAVGSTWIRALRAKLNKCAGRLSIVDAQISIFLLDTDSVAHLTEALWTSRPNRWLTSELLWRSLYLEVFIQPSEIIIIIIGEGGNGLKARFGVGRRHRGPLSPRNQQQCIIGSKTRGKGESDGKGGPVFHFIGHGKKWDNLWWK